MNECEKKARGRRVRHIMAVFVLLLLVCSVGTVTFDFTDPLTVLTLSKTSANPADTASSLPQLVSQPSPGSALSSAISSEPSSDLDPASEPLPSSSPPASSSAVSSAPPMNPAVYQAMYPTLYMSKFEIAAPEPGKVVYLTFDDGPSNLTLPLLDVLDQFKVKATFFLIGKTDAQSLTAMKAIVERGHVIGVHSYTHQYQQIYATPAAFLSDFARMHDLILNTTGVDTPIYRYAGGSVNGYDQKTAKAIIEEMNRRGYVYYDWNVSSGDAEYGATAQSIYNATIAGVHAHTQSVVLFHNTAYKGNTLSQMPKIIETLQKEGYRFETLNPSVDNRPYIFRVPGLK